MTYEHFEDLPYGSRPPGSMSPQKTGWKQTLRCSRGFRDVDRAALSVSNNIAEGFERGTTSELLTIPSGVMLRKRGII
jgi:hypothetical protein